MLVREFKKWIDNNDINSMLDLEELVLTTLEDLNIPSSVKKLNCSEKEYIKRVWLTYKKEMLNNTLT